MSGERVLLMTLSERTSARGTVYLAGWLGKARVVAFKSRDLDQHGCPQWSLFVSDPAPRADPDQAPRQPLPLRGQATHDRARRASLETKPGYVEAWDLPREETPFYDDSEAATRDLEGRDW